MPALLLASVLAVSTFLTGSTNPAWAATPVEPIPIEGLVVIPPPQVTAKSWILYDATYDLVLASEAPDEQRAMASTTKMMTALVALDDTDQDRVVTISQVAADVGEAEIGLVAGERLPLDTLVKAMLIRSGNDAAVAIAQTEAGSVAAFSNLMNDKAAELGLENTHFTNPHGLDEPGHYSSARDLLTIARAGMQDQVFASSVWARGYLFPDAPDGTDRPVANTNQLLWDYEGALGIKTGFTFDAGLVLVSAAHRDGRTIYVVVMGSEGERAHFDDTVKLLDYGFDEYGVVPLIVEGRQYGIGRFGTDEYPLVASANAEAFIHLAATGLLADPELGVVNGRPVLEIADHQLEVPIEQPVSPLPELADAFGWFLESSS